MSTKPLPFYCAGHPNRLLMPAFYIQAHMPEAVPVLWKELCDQLPGEAPNCEPAAYAALTAVILTQLASSHHTLDETLMPDGECSAELCAELLCECDCD